MMRSSSLCNTYEYGDAEYWDARYLEEAGASFDWYQRYSALRPFLRKFIPCTFRVLMVGCGNSLMSEDMVKDGYVDIMNIDISYIVIEMMRKSYAHIPQLKYMQMDVRDMSFFADETFDSVIDKGTLDSLMCGTGAPLSASQMMNEVNRLLKPGGIFVLITYGDPSVRIPHLIQPGCCWKITLYVILCQNLQLGRVLEALLPVAARRDQQWSPFPLQKRAKFHQNIFSKIRILTTFMFARRWKDQVNPVSSESFFFEKKFFGSNFFRNISLFPLDSCHFLQLLLLVVVCQRKI